MSILQNINTNIARLERELDRTLFNATALEAEIKANKEQAARIIESGSLVCIFDHGVWRKEAGKGYTKNLYEAGLYTLDQAKEIKERARDAKFFNAITGKPC